MVTPTQKIGLGVAEINAAEPDNTPPPKVDLSRFAKGPKNLGEVISMVGELRLNADAFAKRMATLQAEEKRQREQITAEVSKYSGISQSQKIEIIAREKSKARRDLLDITDKERFAVLTKIQQANEGIQAVRDMYKSPAVMLMREGLGTQSRMRLPVRGGRYYKTANSLWADPILSQRLVMR